MNKKLITLQLDDETTPSIDFAPIDIIQEVTQNIRNIFRLTKGTVPYQRGIGLDERRVDLPIEKAIMLTQMELVEQLRKYEPRAKIKKFDWRSSDFVNGRLVCKLSFLIYGV